MQDVRRRPDHRQGLYRCGVRVLRITSKLVKAEGVTEKLKATDQMEWARRMSSICDRAEEVVLAELIYC